MPYTFQYNYNGLGGYGKYMYMKCDPTGQYVFVGGNNELQRSTNGGQTFSTVSTSNTYRSSFGVYLNGSYVTLTEGYHIWVSSNYGVTWNEITTVSGFANGAQRAQSTCVSADGVKMLLGLYSGGVFCSTNSGASWFLTSLPISKGAVQYVWQSLAMNSTGSVMYAYNEQQVYRSTNSGSSWVLTSAAAVSGTFGNTLVCDPTGNYVVAVGNSITSFSTNSGSTWRNVNFNACNVAITSDGQKIFLTSLSSPIVYFTTNYGVTIGQCLNFSTYYGNYQYIPLAVSDDVTKLYLANYGNVGGLYGILTYQNTLLPPTSITVNGSLVQSGGTYTAIARTQSVNVVATPATGTVLNSITGTTGLVDDLNIVTINVGDSTFSSITSSYNIYVMVLRNCFLEGTKILCYIDNEEKYIPIEQMKEGTLVKTPLNGYVAVNTIGHSKIYNPADKLRGENRLYKRTKDTYPELIEDLIVTGCHSILVEDDRITPEIREKTKELFKHEIMLTDKKIRLLTCLDDLAEPYEEEGVFTIWHFALEHFDDYMNYGVWANGLLMETCSINMMRQYSGLELV